MPTIWGKYLSKVLVVDTALEPVNRQNDFRNMNYCLGTICYISINGYYDWKIL